MKTKIYQLPWAIILAGIFFTLYLLSLVPDEVYFSGDGALKALVTQQWGTGQFRFDLVQSSQAWVRQLWEDGLYPYEEPFVYHVANRYYITFPFTFSLVTAPFYALFGYRGLYIVPLVSTWVIWLTCYWACQRLKFNVWRTSATLLIVIFASNLTLYSAMYWEHTLAVALCFLGMMLLLVPEQESKISIKTAVLSGVFVGLSAWVRSEFLAAIATLAFVVYLAALLDNFKGKFGFKTIESNYFNYLSKYKEIFVASMAVTVGLFFVCNKLVYGNFLGIHALQIVEEFSWLRRLSEAWASFKELSFVFFVYFPVAIFPLLYLLIYIFSKLRLKFGFEVVRNSLLVILAGLGICLLIIKGWRGLEYFLTEWSLQILILAIWFYLLRKVEIKLDVKAALIYLICLVFTIGVSLLVDSGADEIAVGGKQWGPRYLLILIPFVTFTAMEQLKYLRKYSHPTVTYLGIGIISLLFIFGVHKNIYQGVQFFSKNHQGVIPAIEFLDQNPDKVVAVSHHYASQVLEYPLRDEKLFFLAKDNQDLVKLGANLLKQNQSHFIYVCYPYNPCQPPQDNAHSRKFTQGNQQFQIELSELGEKGKYTLYEASIVAKNLTRN